MSWIRGMQVTIVMLLLALLPVLVLLFVLTVSLSGMHAARH